MGVNLLKGLLASIQFLLYDKIGDNMIEALSQFMTFLINGLLVGGMYSLFALGLAIVYGVFKVLNFAHGEFYMLGGYIAFYAWSLLGLHNLIGMVLAIGGMILFGILLERSMVTPLFEKGGEMYALIITFALSILLSHSVMILAGPYWKNLPSLMQGSARFGGVVVGFDRLASFAVSILLVIIFWMFIFRTYYGKAIRAVAHDKEIAALMGINTDRIQMITFGLGAGLAAAAGVLLSTTFVLSYDVGNSFMVKAFVIIVIGGMGSMRGAIVGGILLGVAEALASAYISTVYGSAFGFVILIITLVIRPSGIFGYEMK